MGRRNKAEEGVKDTCLGVWHCVRQPSQDDAFSCFAPGPRGPAPACSCHSQRGTDPCSPWPGWLQLPRNLACRRKCWKIQLCLQGTAKLWWFCKLGAATGSIVKVQLLETNGNSDQDCSSGERGGGLGVGFGSPVNQTGELSSDWRATNTGEGG